MSDSSGCDECCSGLCGGCCESLQCSSCDHLCSPSATLRRSRMYRVPEHVLLLEYVQDSHGRVTYMLTALLQNRTAPGAPPADRQGAVAPAAASPLTRTTSSLPARLPPRQRSASSLQGGRACLTSPLRVLLRPTALLLSIPTLFCGL